MDKQFEKQAKEKLLKQKHDLEKGLSGVGDKTDGENYSPRFPNYGDDEESAVSEVEDYGANVDIENNLTKELKATNAALKRINEGKYGLCCQCGKEIGLQRLKAYPAADFCYGCEKK